MKQNRHTARRRVMPLIFALGGCGPEDRTEQQPDAGWSPASATGGDSSDIPGAPDETSTANASSTTSESVQPVEPVGSTSSSTGKGPTTSGVGAGDSTSTGPEGSSTGTPIEPCTPAGSQLLEFSYIWLANTDEGTLSKIDTTTGEELGRYLTRPDGAGSPSRTSVNRDGDVVVANRAGGVTKVYADPADCVESNGIPGIQTSSGPGDVLPWGVEECIAWHTEINRNSNRPVAWTSGTLNPQTCEYENVDVFTAYSNRHVEGSIEIARLDGTDGVPLAIIPLPEIGVMPHGFGLYGAATDRGDNVWFSQLDGGHLIRVNGADDSVETWETGSTNRGYGMTVTEDGYVWLCGRQTHRFDPETATWTSTTGPDVPLIFTGGCMGDGNGVLYRASDYDVVGLDTETLETVVTLPARQLDDDSIWGVAVDFEGYVWAVPRNGSRAYRLDPSNPANPITLTVTGLVSAYTYSDMTGFALFSVQPG